MTRRLYIPPPLVAGRVEVVGEPHHYVTHVLRLTAGDDVVVFDGNGREAEARIGTIARDWLTLEVLPARDGKRGAQISLLVGLLKGDKMDLVVQKAGELGAARLIPLATTRAVAKLPEGERGAAKLARWRKIALEAARQCGRADALEVTAVDSLEGALRLVAPGSYRILFHEGARAVALRDVLPPERPAEVAVVIGPEGGLTDEEIDHARTAGFVLAGLGPRVLRAETAVLTALAVLGYALGDLGGA
jgi:16S rRNA (uracil1498-N3)-methyltransferase